jgi:hypothetical protein
MAFTLEPPISMDNIFGDEAMGRIVWVMANRFQVNKVINNPSFILQNEMMVLLTLFSHDRKCKKEKFVISPFLQ